MHSKKSVQFSSLCSLMFSLYYTHSDSLYKALVSPHICLITFWFCHHLTNQGRPCDNHSFHKWNCNFQNVGLLLLRIRRTFNPPILWLQLPFALLLGKSQMLLPFLKIGWNRSSLSDCVDSCFSSILNMFWKYIRLWVRLVYKGRGCLYTPFQLPLTFFNKFCA